MRQERKENTRRVNRERGARKARQIRRKIPPHSAHARAEKKTMFNCFNLGTQSTLIRFDFVSPSFQSISDFNSTVNYKPQ